MARRSFQDFINELKRRNVFRAGAAYAIVAWLVIQAAAIVLPTFNAPQWAQQIFIILVLLGFVLVLLGAWAYELTPEGIKATDESGDARAHPVRWRVADFLVVGVLLVAIGFLGMNLYWVFDTSVDANVASVDAARPRERLENSVAVLPFVSLSPEPNDAFFASGIHEEILNYLVKVKAINVIARTTMMRYDHTAKSITQIADELNVQTVMEGTVRYAGNRVRVTAQLIDAATGTHLFSEAYERDFADIFAIQADIARNVAEALEAEFSVEEQQRLARSPTVSVESYALYLQYLNLIGSNNQGAQALAMLDQIIENDPDFAEPYGEKAYVYVFMLINSVLGRAGDQIALEELVRDNAERSLELDPYGYSARSALALLNVFFWSWSQAQQLYDEYESETGGIAMWHEWFATWTGNDARAIEIASRFAELNPLDYSGSWRLGIALISAGAYDAAAESFRKAISLAPALPMLHSWLAWAEIARGDNQSALRELQRTEQLLGTEAAVISLLDVAYGYRRIGRNDDANRLTAEIMQRSDELELGAGGWAMFYLASGDEASALRWLQQGAEKAQSGTLDVGFLSLMVLKENVCNDPVLNRPEFVEVRRILTGR